MSNKQSINCKSTVKKADRSHLENLTLLNIIVDKTLIYIYIYIYIYIHSILQTKITSTH